MALSSSEKQKRFRKRQETERRKLEKHIIKTSLELSQIRILLTQLKGN